MILDIESGSTRLQCVENELLEDVKDLSEGRLWNELVQVVWVMFMLRSFQRGLQITPFLSTKDTRSLEMCDI